MSDTETPTAPTINKDDIYSVYMIKYCDPENPILICQATAKKEAVLRAEKVRDERWDEGFVLIEQPKEGTAFLPIKFILEDGTELPLVDFAEDKLNLVRYPDKNLKLISKPLKEKEVLSEEMKKFLADMVLTMYLSPGIGLAASQVGVYFRLAVIDPHWAQRGKIKPAVIINPEIITRYDEQESVEGCLSVPGGFHAPIKRAEEIVITYRDSKWEGHTATAYELDAAVYQHEIDHMDGKIFLDHLSRLKRDRYDRKLKKIHRIAKKRAKQLIAFQLSPPSPLEKLKELEAQPRTSGSLPTES